MTRIFIIVIFLATGTLPGFSQQPNIIFIYADDWGYGDLSLHRHHTITTPNLDRLAAEGTEFLQFNVCNPVCSPSRAAIMTGQYPARHHIHRHFADHDSNMGRDMPDWLDPSAPMLSRLFSKAGYRTAHYGKWHLTNSGVTDPPLPVNYGYDEARVFNGPGPQVGVPIGISTGKCVDYSMDFISHDPGKPFFINLWIHESHARIDPPQDAKDAYAHVEEPYRSYYACISYADRELGRLFQFLKDEGLDSTTLVVFSSDNGPESPHDDPERVTYYSRGETAGLVGQKRSLFEGGVGLPFIVHWPGRVPAGKINNITHIAGVDILPSFCKVAGIDLPADYISDGEDLSGSLLGGDQLRTKPLFWDWRGPSNGDNWPRMAVRSGAWKLLCNEDGSLRNLFNIQASRVEESDSATYYPELADSLFQVVSNWKESLPDNISMNEVQFFTDKKGMRVIIDPSGAGSRLGRVTDPEFRLYRSDPGEEIIVDSISHDTLRIYLHISPDQPLGSLDQLSIAFRKGEITTLDGASLLFFSTEPVQNRIQTGPDLFTMEFNLFDGSNEFRLPEVTVSVDSVNLLTNMNGEAFFSLPEGTYIIGADKENYTSNNETLALNSDTLIRIFLHPTLATVKFRITDGTIPLSGAEIDMDEKKKLTNAVGITLFEAMTRGLHYPYSITRNGFFNVQDTLLLNSDTTVQAILSPATGNQYTSRNGFSIFPNPAKENLHIIAPEPISEVALYNLDGKLIRKMKIENMFYTLPLTGIAKGTYFLSITLDTEERETVRQMINIL